MRGDAGLHERFGQCAIGGEVQIGEENLARAQQGIFRRVRLLDLHDHVRLRKDLR